MAPESILKERAKMYVALKSTQTEQVNCLLGNHVTTCYVGQCNGNVTC